MTNREAIKYAKTCIDNLRQYEGNEQFIGVMDIIIGIAEKTNKEWINKACEWLEEYTTRTRKTNIGNGVCEFQFMHPLQVTEMLTELRKVMEE